MANASTETPRNWQSVRTVLEGAILAALIWTGNSLIGMKVQMATMQGQLAIVSAQLADVSNVKGDVTSLKAAMVRAEADVKELRQTRGLR